MDESFSADPALSGEPTALLPLDDGSLLVAFGTAMNDHVPRQLVKLRADGRIDATWAASSFDMAAPQSSASIVALATQADGRVLAGGNFTTVNGAPRQNLGRFNRDGTVDRTSSPADAAVTGINRSIAVQADSRIVVANGCSRPAGSTKRSRRNRWRPS